MRTVHRIVLLGACLYLGGCTGQLKNAMLENSRATKTVADTLAKVAASMKCDSMPADQKDGCTAAVSVIQDQAKALRKGAEDLDTAAR
jgi:hypothetical protein